MRTIIEKTYKPTHSTNPIWRVSRKVTTRTYIFDHCDPETGEILGQTRLYWKHDTQDKHCEYLYHGCSYRFSGYNPMPVTDWFYGVPLKQMLDWCMEHDLHFIDCISEYITINYVDDSWEATHPDF